MEHVAIDLGGKESQICVRGSDGKIIDERRVATSSLATYLKARPSSRVVIETCAEAFGVADSAKTLGHEVRVVPATLVRSLGVGARKIKTDVRDARNLSEASCRMDLPSVHIPSEEARRRKAVCGMREALVHSRTLMVNTVKGWLRGQGLKLRSGPTETVPVRVRERFTQAPARPLPDFVERQLQTIEQLSKQIDLADAEVKALSEQDPVCQRLRTVPGVGPVTSVRFAAALDEVGRFPSAHAVESYLGLTPGENSSSAKTRRTGITKAGAPRVRWVLVQAAWVMRQRRPNDPMVLWSREVEKRRGKAVAVMALVRKLAGVLFAIWRDGSTYDPARGARPVPPPATPPADAAAMAEALALLTPTTAKEASTP